MALDTALSVCTAASNWCQWTTVGCLSPLRMMTASKRGAELSCPAWQGSTRNVQRGAREPESCKVVVQVEWERDHL
jgi:hypothetical protein